jgi:gluconolactonase
VVAVARDRPEVGDSRMFQPPPSIESEVFARLPEKFRRNDAANAWALVNRRGQPTHSFLEGSSFDRTGNLYVVDIPYGRIFRISPNAEFELVAEYEGEPNGLKIHRDGGIFVTDYRHGLMTVDLKSGKVSTVLERRWSERFKGVNDLTFAKNGDIYFTDQGQTGMHDPTGRVYRLRVNGTLDLIVDNIPSPNGLVLNGSEHILYVAATRGNCVWRVPLMPDGTASKVGIFVQLSGSLGGPDGLAMDEEDNLVVAHAGLGSVWVFSRIGEPLWRVRSCQGLLTTNIAYGGADHRTLYITESESGCVLKSQLPVPGRAMYSHQ